LVKNPHRGRRKYGLMSLRKQKYKKEKREVGENLTEKKERGI
jgi:hypothetical protein